MNYLEENDHALQEGLKVEDVVDALGVFHVHEERHSEDGVDKHDQHEQQSNVEERWHGDSQREQQRPDALG